MEENRKKLLTTIIIFVTIALIGPSILMIIDNMIGVEERLKDLSIAVNFFHGATHIVWGGILFYLISRISKF